MDRRDFLTRLPVLGALLLEYNQLFGRSLPRLFLSQGGETLMVYAGSGAPPAAIPILWRHGIAYISAGRFAEAFDVHTYFNPDKRKIVLYLPGAKVVVSADNPFVLIDGRPLQMPAMAAWERGEIMLPIAYVVPLLTRYSGLALTYSPDRQVLSAGSGAPSLSGMTLDVKENGVVARIPTDRRFQNGEMTLDMRYDWLHLDLYRADVNAEAIRRARPSGPVREIKVIEFDELVSIAFRLRNEPLSKELYQDNRTGEVVVVLRYKEELSEMDGEEAAGDGARDDDLQEQLAEERKRWLIDTVVIDPGHGGKDPGAIGVGKLREKDVVLPVALHLGEIVRKQMPDVRIVYTRREDEFIELRRRTQIANENNGKVFVSIHANANRSKNAHGFETYILGSEKGDQARNVVELENSVIRFEDAGSQAHYEGINKILATLAQSAFLRHSEHLASNVQDSLQERLRSLNMRNRGVKQGPFWVMVGASMPCILVELGFVTNAYEARILKTASHQRQMAEGIFAGLRRFKEDYENAI